MLARIWEAIRAVDEFKSGLVLGAFALAVRLAAMLVLRSYEFGSTREMGFEMGRLAASLARGTGFSLNGEPSAWMAPLFPAILWLVFEAFGIYSIGSAVAILTIQALVSALTAMVIYIFGKRLLGHKVGLLAGVLWAVSLGAINYSVRRIWSSTFAALGVLLIIVTAVWIRDNSRSRGRAVIAGLVIRVAALFEPVSLAAASAAVI